jgi:SP family galactose:H+ symporter-like MFS transporter
MYYAPRIFGMAGYGSAQDQLWGTVVIGAVNVLATFIAIGLVDRWGRKPILYTGCTVMALGMGTLSLLLQLGVTTPTEQIAAAATLLLFIVGFAMSAGPLVWILCSEIQPMKGRDFGIAVSTFTNWIANMLAGATFLTLINTFGAPTTFGGYAVMNVVFILLVIWLVPETKGVSLEQIERNLLAGKPLRRLGQ